MHLHKRFKWVDKIMEEVLDLTRYYDWFFVMILFLGLGAVVASLLLLVAYGAAQSILHFV